LVDKLSIIKDKKLVLYVNNELLDQKSTQKRFFLIEHLLERLECPNEYHAPSHRASSDHYIKIAKLYGQKAKEYI
jgi:hypothetical protein